MSLIERIANQSRLDNDFLLQNDRIGRASRTQENVVLKMKPRDEEAIKEYQDQFPNSYERQDADGNTKHFKFQLPENEPEMEYVPNAYEDDSKEMLEAIDNNMKYLTDLAADGRAYMEDKNNQILKIQEKINNGLIKKKDVKRSIELIDRLKGDVLKTQGQVQDIENEIQTFPLIKQQELDDLNARKAEIKLINQGNMERLQSYKDEINQMNRGQFDVVRQPEESEEAYITRLRQTAQIEVPEQQLERAKNYTVKKFKELLKELIRSPSIIEQISNSPEIDNFGEITNKIALVKIFPLIKKKFSEVYGINNTNLNANDIINFLKHFMDRIENENGIMPEPVQYREKKFDNPLGLSDKSSDYTEIKSFRIQVFPESEMIGIMKPPFNKETLYLKIVINNTDLNLIYSFTGNQGSFRQYDRRASYTGNEKNPYQIEIIEDATGIDGDDFMTLFNTIHSSRIAKIIGEKYHITPISIHNGDTLKIDRFRQPNNKQKEVTVGFGVHTENIPETAHFGELVIFPKKLYYDNKMVVKNSKMNSIAGLKNTTVSDNFVKLIMSMLSNHHPTNQDINKLSSSERQLYDRMIILSKLHKIMPHQGDRSGQELKQRLKLIEGEIEIGNNSPLLLKEIYAILHSLKDMGIISIRQVKDYLSQFE